MWDAYSDGGQVGEYGEEVVVVLDDEGGWAVVATEGLVEGVGEIGDVGVVSENSARDGVGGCIKGLVEPALSGVGAGECGLWQHDPDVAVSLAQ